ncbi:hypothetical protein A9975_24850 [Cupriavidus sp. UME77]|nr:hypothetical protein [Cupriavidus sp. UME77]MBB1634070.1 hypothetical protein [Cupriavidus sp. UME77]
MTNDALQHKVISDIPAFRALQPEWDALWHTAQGEHFQAFAYCASSLEVVAAAAGHKLHCVVGRRRGALKVLWPLVSYRKLCWRFVQPLAPAYNPPHDMLVEPGPDAANLVAATWREMLASVRPDLVYLPRVRSGALLLDQYRAGRKPRIGRVVGVHDQVDAMAAHSKQVDGHRHAIER